MHAEWIRKYFARLVEAEGSRPKAISATIKMQALFRSYRVRKWFLVVTRRIIWVQCAFRQSQAKKRASLARREVRLLERAAFFSFWATTIQRYFRGFVSRKHKHDFYARKAYVAKIASVGESVLISMREEAQAQVERAAQQQAADAEERLVAITRQLHHLVSTKNIPGVYRPPKPYKQPSIKNRPVEEIIQEQVKKELAKKQVTGKISFATSSFHEVPDRFRTPLISITANIGRQKLLQGPFAQLDGSHRLPSRNPTYRREASLPPGIRPRVDKRLHLYGDFHVTKPAEAVYLGGVAATSLFVKPLSFREDYEFLNRTTRFKLSLPRNHFFHEN